jgi:Ser/Thr protein kinase RdoA (MazF antagonist)
LPAADGSTITQHRGRLWEVAPWMLGIPDVSSRLSDARRTALWRALAQFHRAVADSMHPLPRGRSPGLVERLQTVDGLAAELARLRSAETPRGWEKLDACLNEYLRLAPIVLPAVRAQLVEAARDEVPLVPCIRDIRREHVLFSDDEVSGWVDYGALADENPAADVARVLREFFDDEEPAWPTLLVPYDEALAGTPLGRCSLPLVRAFDRSGILLAPANWLRWIYLERRDIEGFAAIVARLDQLLLRLCRLAESQ